MPSRFFRRRWAESRGDEFDGWGHSVWYFEVGEDGWPVRWGRVTGPRRHIAHVDVLRAATTMPTAQFREVADVRWLPVTDIAGLGMPPELPAMVTAAASWARTGS